MKQITKSITKIEGPIGEIRPDIHKDAREPGTKVRGSPEPPREEHGGPDKNNDIRNEVADTQPSEVLNPDLQRELMEIVKRRCDEFERELHHITPDDQETVQHATQKFKDELLDNARKKLTQ